MCGIAGIVKTKGDSVTADLLAKISKMLSHRGPDDVGFLGLSHSKGAVVTRDPSQIDGTNVALVHRRLSILDLSEAGWQPMQSIEHTYSIVFNGEIYNYIELRTELEKCGHTFDTQSDTEVLLKAYMEWGAGALPRLIGMFAFAILDMKRASLFLARDFFGIKPLYYCHSEDAFGFASETNTLLCFPGISRRVNTHRLFPYLRFGITDYGNETLWRDIYQVPAAHYMEIPLYSHGIPSPVRYWNIPQYEPLRINYEEASKHLRDLLMGSVRMHLRSDVPVGACLSGGLDSSAIVMAMRNSLGKTGELLTFSYLADDKNLNEETWINIAADAAKTKSYRICPSETDLLTSIEDMVISQGEPFGSTSIFAQYKVFELAGQQRLKVMLDGQGADELLAGYSIHLGARIASLLSQTHIFLASQLYLRGCKFPDASYSALAAMAAGMLVPDWLQQRGRKVIDRDLLPSWLNQSWFKKQGSHFIAPFACNGPHYLRAHLVESLSAVSLPMLLRYEDRNSMRFSIESRVPFLTRQIAEFLLSLPEEYLVDQHGMRKSILRSAMRGIVPDAILDRRDKIGFAAPEHTWMRTLASWVEQRLNSEAAHAIPALNLKEAKANWQCILSGHRRDISSFTWRWINLIEWTQLFNAEYEE